MLAFNQVLGSPSWQVFNFKKHYSSPLWSYNSFIVHRCWAGPPGWILTRSLPIYHGFCPWDSVFPERFFCPILIRVIQGWHWLWAHSAPRLIVLKCTYFYHAPPYDCPLFSSELPSTWYSALSSSYSPPCLLRFSQAGSTHTLLFLAYPLISTRVSPLRTRCLSPISALHSSGAPKPSLPARMLLWMSSMLLPLQLMSSLLRTNMRWLKEHSLGAKNNLLDSS